MRRPNGNIDHGTSDTVEDAYDAAARDCIGGTVRETEYWVLYALRLSYASRKPEPELIKGLLGVPTKRGVSTHKGTLVRWYPHVVDKITREEAKNRGWCMGLFSGEIGTFGISRKRITDGCIWSGMNWVQDGELRPTPSPIRRGVNKALNCPDDW